MSFSDIIYIYIYIYIHIYIYIYVDKELLKYFLVRAYELIIHNSKALTKKYFDNYLST